MSAVNLAEVVSKAVDFGGTLESISGSLAPLPLQLVPFAPEDSMIAASLRAATRSRGLSLGDRACLALGLKLGSPVLTTEGRWRELDVGVVIEVIR
jgi:PIN domain nuclease of toxin-antitoxin system